MAILTLMNSTGVDYCMSLRRPHPSGDLGLNGDLIVGFKPDGTLELGDTVSDQDAAVAFFRVVGRLWHAYQSGHFREDYTPVFCDKCKTEDGHNWLVQMLDEVPVKARMREFL